jgi:hypothetical protein
MTPPTDTETKNMYTKLLETDHKFVSRSITCQVTQMKKIDIFISDTTNIVIIFISYGK